jgi:hypothetical protein
MMDIAQIRLECLKLAHRSDLPPNEVVGRAVLYEQYVVQREQVIPENRTPKRPGGQAGKTAER